MALLVDANIAVSVDQLVDRVWAENPPARVRDSLYGYLSRLRRVFAALPDVALDRRSAGYVLSVDPARVDLLRFRSLARRARAVTEERALSLFDEALDQWQGDALADLTSPWLDELRERLHQERLGAELDRNDLALRHGQHARLLPELLTSAAEHPFDERIIGQLILALYQSGRRADALACYERARRLLADELGTDPSPGLQALHQQMMAAGAIGPVAGPAPAAPPPVTALPIPRQLPAAPPLFVGRSRELAEISSTVDQAGAQGRMAITVIGGSGGIGKTWLALRWAHDHLSRFPDGQLYLNLRGFDPVGRPTATGAALNAMLAALGVPPGMAPAETDAQAALFRSLVSNRRMLVLLDNAQDADQVRPLLPGSPHCTVIITSRQQMPGLVTTEGARHLAVDLLSPDEARHLLAVRIGEERAAANGDALAAIVTAAAGLPLALAVVAARAGMSPAVTLRALADDLAADRDRLNVFAGNDQVSDVRAVFSWSYRTLSPPAARMFRLLGLPTGPDIATAAAASLAGIPLPEARGLLDELARAHLVTMTSRDRFTMHDLLRAYADELVGDAEARAALSRMFDHYLHTAHAAALVIEPHREALNLAPAAPGVVPEGLAAAGQARRWLTTERPVLLAAIDHAFRAGCDGHAWRLAWTLTTFLSRGSHWSELATAQQVALDAATRAGDLLGQAHAHRDRALARNQLGHRTDAVPDLKRAAALFGELGDLPGQAHTLLTLGWICERHGQQQDALRYDQQALAMFQTAGHEVGQAKALNAVGWDHAQLGDHEQAIHYCEQALELHDRLGNATGAARAWDSLGYAHSRLGQHQQALASFQRALGIYRDAGDHYTEAETLTHVGDTYRALGDHGAAEEAWRQALERYGDGNPTETDEVLARLQQLLSVGMSR
ncbi:BTAD domain-containing putative transcriptional regulator [Micromonospora sp. HK10]|uniref:AfsR/SARP family transcriptional regulator n=1 Tax=Micromonospora sp. HK10 TaxID=1538294 RepID=UPI001E5CE38C|nr:BTAD domain-containing putative transcriptional regulator [Micromonospora sp. HK10]